MSSDLQPHIARSVTSSGLKLIVNTTEQCNLRCVYCYESFQIGQMSDEITEALVDSSATHCRRP